MTDTKLYAWVNPLSIDKKIDHTWVTTYAPPPIYDDINDVVNAGEHCWYCWGSYHPKGNSSKYSNGAIGNASGNLAFSQCICQSNDKNAHGTVFTYAWDGVCHQLANQVLYSTNGPLTVKLARGYAISSFLYGTYGANNNDWLKKVISCSTRVGIMINPSTTPEDFAEIFTAATGENVDSDKYTTLMVLRAKFQAELQQLRQNASQERNPEAIAKAINDLIAEHMKNAAEILGPKAYKEVYGFEAGEAVSLVDPQFVNAQTEIPDPLKTKASL